MQVAGSLAGRAVALVGDSASADIATGLANREARVAMVDEVTDDAMRVAADDLGGLDAVVWARTPPGAGMARLFDDLTSDEWGRVAERPLHDLLHFLQIAHRLLAAGGRIVVVVPTLALTGSPGHTAWATAAEGQRTFVKLAARAFGPDGITVNCVAIDAAALFSDGREINRAGLPSRALTNRNPSLRDDVAGAIASFIADDAGGVTGATVAVDGGVWMPA